MQFFKRVKRHKVFLTVFLLLLASLFFRFWNYHNRWGLAYDQAQFATVAKYGLDTLQLPLLGPFSSGGPFQTGGEWYWLVMLGYIFSPDTLISPWIFLTASVASVVIVMFFIGKIHRNYLFGVILGLLFIFSPAQIFQSTNLSNQTPITIFSALLILFCLLYLQKEKRLYLFLASLSLGLAASIHIQSVALLPFLILFVVFFKKTNFKNILLIVLGLAIPWLPVLIADSQNNFYNTIQMLNYFTNPQTDVSYDVLGRRWLTFVTEFIPYSWGSINGGNNLIAYILIAGSGILFIYELVKRRISKEILVTVVSLFLMYTILRYIKTPLFESFYVFIHPFIIFISGWFVYFIYRKSRLAGVLFLGVILVFSFINFWGPINKATNNTYKQVNELKSVLYKAYPDSKFSVYDYDANNSSISMPLSLSLYFDDKISENGFRIGLYRRTPDSVTQILGKNIYGDAGNLQLFEISSSESGRLKELGWNSRDPKSIYEETQYWFISR